MVFETARERKPEHSHFPGGSLDDLITSWKIHSKYHYIVSGFYAWILDGTESAFSSVKNQTKFSIFFSRIEINFLS